MPIAVPLVVSVTSAVAVAPVPVPVVPAMPLALGMLVPKLPFVASRLAALQD